MLTSLRRVLASCLVTSAIALLVACHLTPQQAAIFNAVDVPLCAAVGGGIAVESTPLGAIVALLCPAVAAEIVAAETTQPVDAGAAAVDAGANSAKASTSVPAAIAVSAGCVPVAVPGDPLHQTACPELHARVLAASSRVMARALAALWSR